MQKRSWTILQRMTQHREQEWADDGVALRRGRLWCAEVPTLLLDHPAFAMSEAGICCLSSCVM